MSQKITDAEKATYLDRTTELLNRVKNGTVPMLAVLAGLQKLIEGDFGSTVVDLDADPFVPERWRVLPEDQIKSALKGQLDATKIALYFSEGQKGDKRIRGDKLREELEGQPVVGANALDFLLKKEKWHLIPEEWKSKAVFFWGTIYRRRGGDLCVRCLYWDGVGWRWSYDLLGRDWYSDCPAVVSAS